MSKWKIMIAAVALAVVLACTAWAQFDSGSRIHLA